MSEGPGGAVAMGESMVLVRSSVDSPEAVPLYRSGVPRCSPAQRDLSRTGELGSTPTTPRL